MARTSAPRGEVRFDGSDGELARGDGNVPLSSAGRIFVNVLVTVRCDDDGKSLLRRIDAILNDDELEDDTGIEGEDDCSI